MPRTKRHRSHAREKSRKIMLGMKGGFFWPFTSNTSNKPTTSPPPKSSMFSSITNLGNPISNSQPAPAPTPTPALSPPAPALSPPAPALSPPAPQSSSITGGRRRRRHRSRRRRSTRSRR
jgi:hypothetical protein